jgi:branched-subunit amino acid transport protein
MSAWLVIIGLATVTWLPRYLGLRLSGRDVSPFWLRFFGFVPIAVFPALITPALAGDSGEGGARLIAALLAALASWRLGRLWVSIVVGMAAFWLLRLVF